jgi:hypothetical protein
VNRKERRRNKINSKPVTICLTEEQLQCEIEKANSNSKSDTIKNTVHLVTAVIALALNSQFNFGRIRINKLIERANKDLECIIEGHITKEEIYNWCNVNNININ